MAFIGFVFFVYIIVLSTLLFSLVNIKIRPISTITASSITPKRFSVIIAFRNEASNLPKLIDSLVALQYPKDAHEIILVNDHSSDDSVEVIEDFVHSCSNVHLFHLKEKHAGKKAALQVGIEHAQFEYIATTDADCFVPEKWLLALNAKLNGDQWDAIIGAVGIAKQHYFLSNFQYYDLLALQAVGFALANVNQPILSNGANFCYAKAAFEKVNGFQGNQNQPSGDDVLLLQKFAEANMKIGVILHSEHLVLTEAVPQLKTFIQQRKRWFYKTKYSSSLLQKGFGVLLLVVNLSILFLLIMALFKTSYFTNLIILMLVKFCMDFFLTFEMAKKLKLPFCFRDFALANLFYPFGIAVFVFYLTNSKIQWKQRQYHS